MTAASFSRYRAVVIGGGIVGVSVLYHLAKAGWRDVLLLERSELTAGSTWHAAAGFHALNGDPNVARLQAYTIGLYKEVEELGQQSCGLHMTGGLTVAASHERWEWLQAEWSRQKVIGLHSRLVTPEEVKELCPVIDATDIRGGLFDPNEGHLDPNGATHAFANAAKALGASVRLRTAVTGLHRQPDDSWIVATDKGDVHADHVVNAAGLWAPRVGEMVGLRHPIVPMEHMYVVSEPIEAVARLDRELPMTADLDAQVYVRQEQRSLLLGVYEENPRHWHVDGVPWNFGMELIPDDLDRIMEPLLQGFGRFPDLQDSGIKRVVNGGMVFTPDGNPIVGPVAGVPNYWCACGSMAGFSQCGAIGRTVAEWMVEGEPSGNVMAMDVARFGPHVAGRYLLEKTAENYARRFKLAYPNEQLPAARPFRTTPVFDAQKADNAVFGASYGQEFALYFAPPGEPAVERHSFRRSDSFAVVGEECRATRTAAGIMDASPFSKYRVSGPGARAWIARVLAGRVPSPGRIRLSPMLSPGGRLIGDLSVFGLADDDYMIFGSGYLQAFHMRWFLSHAAPGVEIRNLTDAYAGIGISGPCAKAIVAEIAPEVAALPTFAARRAQVGLAPAIVGRLSITGEDGYEIYVPADMQQALYRRLRDMGRDHGLRQIGFYAGNSLRLERGFGLWGREFTPDYTPRMSGLDRFVEYDRDGFIGRDAALCDREVVPARTLVTLTVDADDADAMGDEPVTIGDRVIGFTTSGGYGHTVGRSLAMAYVDTALAEDGRPVTVSIFGRERDAVVGRR